MSDYGAQHRGDAAAYARYLANMDASMRQKVALAAAHLPPEGRVADMGMGSGSGSYALARLYPELTVVGVDVNPEMVDRAAQTYQAPGLSFQQSDIAQACFPPASLDAVLNSSVLHHVTSYNGYRYSEAARALAAQAECLKPNGILIVRDFLAPAEATVRLRLQPRWVPLLQRFAAEFRRLSDHPGFTLQPEADGCTFRLPARLAAEFVLRKDYAEDWDTEILEEYTYFTQAEFEAHSRRLGLRVLASVPLWNPWIVENRFRGQFELLDEAGRPLDDPATNYLLVAERAPRGEGVGFRRLPAEPSGYLRRDCYQDRSGHVWDLVCRPHRTLDLVPFFETDEGHLTVLVRHSYPRPIVTGQDASPDGFRAGGYTVEPLTALQGEEPLGATVEKLLQERAGLAPEDILDVIPGDTLYPSAGGIRESVRSVFVRVSAAAGRLRPTPAAQTGWKGNGQLRALDAEQLLRCAAVGGLPDARLEGHLFSLMRRLGREPGPWLGDTLQAEQAAVAPTPGRWQQPRRREYLPLNPTATPFLEISAHRYQELDADGEVLAEQTLESVRPTAVSALSLATLPLQWCSATGWWAGLQWTHLPAAQAFSGSSGLFVAPAWRLPLPPGEGHSWRATELFGADRLLEQHGLRVRRWARMGGPYFPSPGLTPELVHPLAAAVEPIQEAPPDPLHWFTLEFLLQRWSELQDGHLRCLLLRSFLALRPQA